jgi:hypothetical protein
LQLHRGHSLPETNNNHKLAEYLLDPQLLESHQVEQEPPALLQSKTSEAMIHDSLHGCPPTGIHCKKHP